MSQQPAAAARWYVLGVLIAAYVLSFLDRQILSLLVQPLERAFHISDTQISLLQGVVFALFLAFAGLPLGLLIDRGRRMTIVAGGIAVWSVMTAGCGLVSGYGGLLLCRMGVGAGEAALTPAAHSIIADSFPARRLGLALGVYGMGPFAGAGLALLLGAAVLALLPAQREIVLPGLGAIHPWQLLFLILGGAGVLMAVWIAQLAEPPRAHGKSGSGSLPEVWRYFLRHGQAILLLNLAGAFAAMSAYSASAWVPTFFIRRFAWSASQAGAVYGTIVLLTGIAGVLTGGALSDIWSARAGGVGRVWMIALASLAAMPFALAAPLVPSAWLAAGLLVPLTLLSTMAIGVLPAAQQAMMPSRMRGTASALGVLMINLIGLGIGPTSVALLTDRVFGQPTEIGRSLSLAMPAMLGLATLFACLCLRPYCRALGEVSSSLGGPHGR